MPIAKKGDAADMDKLPFYKKKSGSLFKQICNMRDGLSLQNLSAMDESELLLRLESADRIYATFDKFQTLLEELDLSEMDSSVREDCDAVFISLKAVITKALHCSKSTEDPQASQSRVGLDATMPTFVYAQQRKHQLPVLQIPKFGGVYTEWPNFISMFNTIVGDDEELTNVEKFQHLRSSLKETALDTISSLEINGDNYDIAISMLIKRFDNKRLNFQAHIKEIFGLNIVGTEASSLRTLSDKVNSHLRSLLTMGNKEQLADGLLIHIVQSKLDVTSQMKWEEQTATNVLASWSNMESFLDKRCRMVENVSNALVNQTPCNQVSHKQPNYAKKSFVASESGICALCNSKEHFLYRCERFLKLDPSARYREAKRLKLCLNCLKKGHRAELCKFTNCSKCSKKHNTLLHMQTLTTFTPTAHSSSSDVASSQSNSAVLTTLHSNTSEAPTDTSVLLATAIILIKNRAGSFIPCRALLDSASQLNFITNRLASQLQLHKSRNFTQISGIGQSDFVAEYVVDIVMKSRTQEYSTILSAVVTTTITDNQPQCSLNHERWPIPKNIDSFADPDFFKSQRIDVLIGASHFFELLCVGQVELGPNLPILQKTKLGWIVAGGGQNIIRKSLCLAATQKLSETSETFDTLENLIRSFWEVENNFDETPKQTKEEIDCETHFKSTHIRLPSGEYSVRLPVKGIHNLGDSYNLALSRFKNLERKFVKSPGLKEQYSAFIQEYLELKHMTAVSSLPSDLPIYFLPHHCVHKIDSTTTKLRVVFDGSATTTSGYSLNDLLMAGPTIQPKLFDILIRFRTFPIALTGDICKMYRCIKVSPEDSYLQCILWRNSLDESIRIYKLDTVTYGTKPASFLAIRAMHQLAQDEQGSFPIGCEIVKRDFYVDDLISGANSVEEVLQLMNETKTLLNKGNFSLRKWCTSSPAVLSHIPEEDRDKFLKFHDGSDVTKTLGLIWDPAIDNFLFSFSQILEPKKITKRLVLGMIARFYDPLGLIGPIVAKAKIFLQRLWKENLNWDESLPQSLHSTWLEFCKDFTYINKFSFPRYLLTVDSDIEIHAFCDASLVAYGTCIYISSKFNKYTASNLLCSKSRVSPLKTITIPKLELLAAALQADLLHSIIKIGLFKCKIYCWSDSTVVLAWLKAEASNYNVFVANRITKIQALTKGIEWHYVPSALNPADILSKGSTPKELADSSLWLHGPEFLKGLRSEWPLSPSLVPELPEKRKAAKVFLVADLSTNFKFINSFGKTRRIFGYIYRFYANTKLHDKTFGSLTILEVNRGTAWLIRMIQKAMLSDDYKKLQKGEAVASASKIASLTPFLDESGLMRVGGRIQMSNLHYDSKHPIILPKQHAFTDALIAHFHQKYLHSGPLALLASIRLKYWPIGGLKSVRRVVQKCIRCFILKPKISEHIMGCLPTDRVQASRAFLVTGTDFCGPFYYKSEVRNRPPIKCYICLFICFATKAIHLELVKDLSSGAFIAALKRFISTRGKPKTIWSDNGTNFVGANNELADLKALFIQQNHLKAVHQECLNEGIDWKFIPPRSPHFGGLWEASIKIAKFHFYRIVKLSILDFDELRTIVCQISAIINSRPLSPITENPEDLDVLTPAHFLIGCPFTATVEPDVTLLNINRLGRWQRLSYLQQLFWKKWSCEYLTLLQQRNKWRNDCPNIQTGALVLLKDENLPPLKWPLARVLELIKGPDGIARVAVLKTANGTTKRAVAKLCILPTDTVES